MTGDPEENAQVPKSRDQDKGKGAVEQGSVNERNRDFPTVTYGAALGYIVRCFQLPIISSLPLRAIDQQAG
jgi:hypothetical protein